MITGLAATVLFITLSTFQAAEVSNPVSVTVVDVGGDVTINCDGLEKDLKFFYWYKQSLGQMVETVMSIILHQESLNKKFEGSRFTTTSEGNQRFLKISNVSKEDEATYLCQIGTTYSHKFINATFLAVNDPKHQKSVDMEQNLKSELVQQRDLVTLQCSLLSQTKVLCPAEHSAYWFRTKSEGFHPGIIYIQRNISDQHVERSCSYSLSVRDSYDDRTYYCAVVSCGANFLAEGTNLKSRPESDPVVFILGGLLACCLTVIVLLICYMKQKNACQHGKGGMSAICQLGDDESHHPVNQSNNLEGEVNESNYATVQPRTKEKKKTRASQSDCVYSVVRLDHQHQLHSQ